MPVPFLIILRLTEGNMIKFAVLALVPLCVSCGDSAQPTSPTSPPDVAAYAPPQKKEAQPSPGVTEPIVYARNNVADVYDLARNWASVRSKSRLDRSTEFGGHLIFCNTKAMYCLKSYLEIAVPREYPFPPTWNAAGYQCKLLQAEVEASAVVKAECQLRGNSATAFEYSPQRGVLRYRRICPECGNGYFELISKRGLFTAS